MPAEAGEALRQALGVVGTGSCEGELAEWAGDPFDPRGSSRAVESWIQLSNQVWSIRGSEGDLEVDDGQITRRCPAQRFPEEAPFIVEVRHRIAEQSEDAAALCRR